MTQYVQAKIETIEQPFTAWAILSVVFLLLCAYAYFVNGAISNIVSAKDTQAEISQLVGEISGLESQYLATKESIQSEYSMRYGSNLDTYAVYVAKKGTASLSFNK
jgi:hypothetical protein